MFNFLTTTLTSAVITLLSAIGIYNYLPIDYLEYNRSETRLGSTITTINATDLIKDSRATINTNFTNLNNTKIENSTTSVAAITTLSNLVSIGTITTGVWNGTTLTVGFGGTGSTTLSSNQVLLGNGTTAIKTVVGYGTTGQFLTSNGGVAAPTWQTSAVDQAINYTWTGAHTFNTATTTLNATTTIAASGTSTVPVRFNSLPYAWPTSQFTNPLSISSTLTPYSTNTPLFMFNNGKGDLGFTYPDWQFIASTTLTSASATTTVSNIPPRKFLKVFIETTGSAGNDDWALRFNLDGTGTYGVRISENGGVSGASNANPSLNLNSTAFDTDAFWDISIQNTENRRKQVSFQGVVNSTGANAPTSVEGVGVWNNTTAQINAISLKTGSNNQDTETTKITVYGSRE